MQQKARIKTALLALSLIILFHQFESGYWIIGFGNPKSTAIAYDSNGRCSKWEGEERRCSTGEIMMMQNLYTLYKN